MGFLIIQTETTPATPATNYATLYMESTISPTKRLRTIDDAGTIIKYVGLTTTDTGTNRLQNKDLDDATTFIVDDADTTKKLTFSVGGNTTAITLTIASAQSTAQTLNIPNITASSIIITDTLAQTISGAKTFSAATLFTAASPSISKYNNISTAGAGVVAVFASAATGSVSSTQTNLINYTPPATAGRYRLSFTIANTAGTNTGTTTPTITYTDAAGIAKSYTPPIMQEGSATWLTAATAASKNFSSVIYFSINNAGTAITATFTISGTVATFISATLEQLA